MLKRNLKRILENNSTPEVYNYLIAGQGLAGTLLAYFLEEAGKSVLLIDAFDVSSSSNIAAGIIHPITGRRIVKSWRADELIPFAEKTYELIGKKFRQTYYNQKPILEFYTSVKHQNDWCTRSAEPDLVNYIDGAIKPGEISGITLPLGGILVRKSGFLNIHNFLNDYRKYLINKKSLVCEKLDVSEIAIFPSEIKWKNYSAEEIIFCEGAEGRTNPYFSQLPFIPAKGEIITIKAPGLQEDYILNKGLYILPLKNGLFRVGATNEWNELNSIPTNEAKAKITRLLSEMISVNFTVTEHQAAIRPTIKDRRPFLGKHPVFQRLNIFNGLGTKGVMMAPFFANQMCSFLVHGNKLDKEVNINRFL